jgi:hypothetical protein
MPLAREGEEVVQVLLARRKLLAQRRLGALHGSGTFHS